MAKIKTHEYMFKLETSGKKDKTRDKVRQTLLLSASKSITLLLLKNSNVPGR